MRMPNALTIRQPFLASLLLALLLSACQGEQQSPDTTTPVKPEDPTALIFETVVSPAEWLELKDQLKPVTRIEFLADDQPNLDWSLLSEPESLTRFRCDGPVDGSLASELAKRSELEILNIPNTAWTDADASFVSELTELTLLRIGGRSLTDASVTAFASRPKLRHLHLIGVDMTEAPLAVIAANSAIESLYLDAIDLSGEALSSLIKQRPDLHMHLNQLHLPSDPRQD